MRSDPEEVVCSARGCGHPARFALVWNNPRLHAEGREKTWTACPDHLESLSAFLGQRGFLRHTEPLGRPVEAPPDVAGPA